MKLLLLISVLILLTAPFAIATDASGWHKGYGQSCESNFSIKSQAMNMIKATCEEEIKQCKAVFAEIDKNSGSVVEANKKKLTCEASVLELRNSIAGNADVLIACGAGAIVDPIVELATSIGEGAAAVHMQWEKTHACDKNSDQKKLLITAFNLDVPKLMQVNSITAQQIETLTCAKIRSLLYSANADAYTAARRKSLSPKEKSSLTADEIELLEYIEKPVHTTENKVPVGLQKMVNAAFDNLKIKINCYSPAQQARLYCEMAGTIVQAVLLPGASMAVRSARLAKLSGLKVDNFVNLAKVAERNSAGVGGKITNAFDKAAILNSAGTLSRQERISSFEKLLGDGRKLTKEETDQLMKMHNVGSAEKRGFFELTPDDLKKKLALAQEINPKTGKPYFSKDESNVLMRNGITGIIGKEQARVEGERNLVEGLMVGNTEQTAKGFEQGGQYYLEYLKLTDQHFKSAIGATGADSNINAADFFTAAVTTGLKPKDTVALANRVSSAVGGDRVENLLALSDKLANESVRLANLTKTKGFNNQTEFKEYLLKEQRLVLQDEAYGEMYKKYGQLDLDLFETKDLDSYAKYRELRTEVYQARKDSQKKRWPYKPANTAY